MFNISKKRVKKEAREWGEAIVIALILTLIIRAFVVQAFKIPSSSMHPTLMEGDKLFVSKFIYRFREPSRWEIMVFKYPEDPKKDFIKRVVAFEGETVELRSGSIYINGAEQELPDDLKGNYYYNQEPFAGAGQEIVVPVPCCDRLRHHPRRPLASDRLRALRGAAEQPGPVEAAAQVPRALEPASRDAGARQNSEVPIVW